MINDHGGDMQAALAKNCVDAEIMDFVNTKTFVNS